MLSQKLIATLVVTAVFGLSLGIIKIPVNVDRGKVRWVMWNGRDMEPMVVYWTEDGFLARHPADADTDQEGDR